ncbi:MAG: fructose-specific PTS transporter subunit EIIC [Sodalis sp. (in: enterobacteria)]|uniref:fructose-specific PTS transporter subunit EIIC n=1 Tax=Sodalis sp. (in: enterobacteria) TaxID=1898979 RepID=UPI003F3CE8AB
MAALKPILIIPLIATLMTGLVMIYVVGTPVAKILTALTHWLQVMGTANAVLLGAILGAMMCSDMGGPINNAVYAFGVALLSTQTYGPMVAIMAAGMVPPLGIAVATLIGRRKFDDTQREAGKAAFVLGLCFISEEAIPFAVWGGNHFWTLKLNDGLAGSPLMARLTEILQILDLNDSGLSRFKGSLNAFLASIRYMQIRLKNFSKS